MEKEQGTLINCVYCRLIRPELQGSSDCPFCHGQTPQFRHMRMMDRPTANQEILRSLISEPLLDAKKENIQILVHLLEKVEVYQFDLKTALVKYIQSLEGAVQNEVEKNE